MALYNVLWFLCGAHPVPDLETFEEMEEKLVGKIYVKANVWIAIFLLETTSGRTIFTQF